MNYFIKLFYTLLILGFILSSCEDAKESISVHDKSIKNIKIKSLELDTFKISQDVQISCLGELNILNNKLYFADYRLASVNTYDTTGQFVKRKLTKGRGAQEISSLDYSLPMDNGFFILADYNTYFFNSDWEKQYKNRLDFQDERAFEKVLNNPEPHFQEIYEVGWGSSSFIRQLDSVNVFIPITTSHPKINAYMKGQEAFYNEVYILGMLNITNGKIEKMIGRRPPIYLEKDYRYIPNFKHIHFDIKDDKLFIGYQADSSIYVYNLNNDNYEYKFGYAGKNMNTNYNTTNCFDEAKATYRSDRKKFGYYHYIEYIEETNILFRGYKKGEHSKKDGLQIYKNNALIGHFDVPEQFKVIGYIEPYYYAQGYINEYDCTIQVFRFKLNNL